MHPRNVLKGRIDYETLGQKHQCLEPFLKKGKHKSYWIDFKDPAACRALNHCLLMEYFDLNVEIPEFCLTPRIPMRLNYLLWVEDLVTSCNKDHSRIIRGLDIGTGPCAIFAILAAKKSKWKMVGTEVHPESVRSATENIKRNQLEDLVQIVPVAGTEFLTPLKEHERFDFSMCNPPFFAETEDVLLKDAVPQFWTEKSQLPTEIVCEGGEVRYILQMFLESKGRPIARIFTTMVGVKKHLEVIVKFLRKSGFKNFCTTTFSQGQNCRWGLAWSWDEGISLTNAEPQSKPKQATPFECDFEDATDVDSFKNRILNLLKEIHLEVNNTSESDYLVSAKENTWSHSRRKRRLEQQNKDPTTDCSTPCPPKRVKLDTETPETAEADINKLVFRMIIGERESNKFVKLEYIEGVLGKDGVHQVLQYIKNHLDVSSQQK